MLCVCFRVTSEAQQLALNSRQPPAVPLNWDNTAPCCVLLMSPLPAPRGFLASCCGDLSQAETLTVLGGICDFPCEGRFFLSQLQTTSSSLWKVEQGRERTGAWRREAVLLLMSEQGPGF